MRRDAERCPGGPISQVTVLFLPAATGPIFLGDPEIQRAIAPARMLAIDEVAVLPAVVWRATRQPRSGSGRFREG
jgi:hypothetical protein